MSHNNESGLTDSTCSHDKPTVFVKTTYIFRVFIYIYIHMFLSSCLSLTADYLSVNQISLERL